MGSGVFFISPPFFGKGAGFLIFPNLTFDFDQFNIDDLAKKKNMPQSTQRGKAANENIYLAGPAENTEKNLIFFNNFMNFFLCALCELCKSHSFS